MEKIYFLMILFVTMALYTSQVIPVIQTSLITITALILSGLLPLTVAFSGFSSPATILVGSMFVLSAGLIRTGALEPLMARLAKWSDGSYLKLILTMAATIPLASAFMNNTPVVVMMVPVIMGLGRRFDIPPSKLLMPLSFFAILGGTCTLIGTSTNLIVDEIYHQKGFPALQIFDFTPLGLILLAAGGMYILIFGRTILPTRDSLTALLPVNKRSRYVAEVIVQPGSSLIGKTIKAIFRNKGPLKFLQILRGEEFYTYYQAGGIIIEPHDALILEGSPQELTNLLSSRQVSLGTVVEDSERVPVRTFSLTMFEIVVLPESPYIGCLVNELNLHKSHGLKVMAILRGNRHHRTAIRKMRIKAGDMLLVQGDLKDIPKLKDAANLLVIEDLKNVVHRSDRGPIALAIMIGVILLASLTKLPLVLWAILGIIAMIRTRCLNTEEAIAALDFNVLFLLIGTIPLGTALSRTGLDTDLVRFVTAMANPEQPFLFISALYLITNILTSLLSNTAVAVLMTPLALSLAHEVGVDPKPLILTVAFAASAAFATPISYQTNIIVMGPAGYKFSDYLRVGGPLAILLWLISSIMIPLIWPL